MLYSANNFFRKSTSSNARSRSFVRCSFKSSLVKAAIFSSPCSIFSQMCIRDRPYGLSYCPPGEGKKAECLMKIDNTRVIVSALKKAEDTDGYVLRLYEGSGVPADAVISFPACQTEYVLHLNGFEIKTFLWKPQMETKSPHPPARDVYKRQDTTFSLVHRH